MLFYIWIMGSINNKNFKRVEFDTLKNESGSNKFKISPQRWIKETNAIGIISKSGKYGGGTFARSDIAFELASWLIVCDNLEIYLYVDKISLIMWILIFF